MSTEEVNEEIHDDVHEEHYDEEPKSREEILEEKARQQGWKPFEEWDGDPDDWVTPETFVVRGEMIDKIKHQNKTIKELNTIVDELKKHHQKVSEREYEKAYEQLKNQKKEALADEDYDRVLDIDEKLAETRAYQKNEGKDQGQQATVNPDFEEWRQQPENKWYDNNPVLAAAADRLAEQYVANQQYNGHQPDFEETVNYVTKELKKEFPDKIGGKKKQTTTTVNETTYNNTGGKSKKASVSKLSDEQKKIGQKFVKQGIVKNLNEYAQQLADIGDI